MKKYYSLCVLLLALVPQVGFPQFRIVDNGNIAINTTATPKSLISVNCAGDTLYGAYFKAQTQNGVYLKTDGLHGLKIDNEATDTSYFCAVNMGIRTDVGRFLPEEHSGRHFGIVGCADNATRSFGIFGKVQNASKGAAIYGTTFADFGNSLTDSHLYAGYFHGDAKVTGDLMVSGGISGVILGESAQATRATNSSQHFATLPACEMIKGLYPYTIQLKEPQYKTETEPLPGVDESLSGETEEEYEPGIIEKQYYGKKHFTLSAEKLEEVFPDLVYEREDGTKGVNYVEMIPILVQSINELNGKIEQLTKEKASLTRSIDNKESVEESHISENRNILYQNTPNPFKEQTIIRFSLAENTTNATICVFDMTGKMLKHIPVTASEHSVTVNGWELGEGMFLYSLVVGGHEVDTKRMIITK